MTADTTNKYRKLLDLGYDQILCVVPPGVPVREAGKRPGRKGNDGWYGCSIKSFDPPSAEEADLWHSWGGGAGLRCNGKFVAIDIDTMSPEWSKKVHDAAISTLGPAPLRIGKAPKCLLLYAAADGIEYRNVRFDDGVDAEKPGLVECLSGADGTKWFVATGMHKDTGLPYRWPNGLPHADELTRVDEAQIASFFDRLREALPKAKGASATSSIDREKVDQDGLKGDMDAVEDALANIVNTPDKIDYFEWVRIAAATRGAFQDDPHRGMDAFCDLSERADLDEPTEDPARTYNSVKPPFAVGADYILSLAKRIGTDEYKARIAQAEIEQWFDQPNEAEPMFDLPASQPAALIDATPYAFPEPTAIPKREWLYGTHYIRQFISTTVAPSGVGKSSLSIVEALAMASGKPLLGTQPKGQHRVWLWNGEDPLEEMERRIAAAMLHYGLTREDIGQNLFLNSGRQTEIILAQETRSGVTINEPVERALHAAIKAHALDVLVIDPFVSSHRVTENDNGAIDLVTKRWARIADAGRCSIDLVHHVRKLNGGEVTVEDGRGAVALLATSRSARAIARMTKQEAEKLGLEKRQRRMFRFADGKNNLALPAGDETDWFELASVQLGNGEGSGVECLMNGDSVGVVTRWGGSSDAPVEADAGKEDALLAALEDAEWRADHRAGEAWAGVAVASVYHLDRHDADDRRQIKDILSRLARSGRLKEVVKKDAKRMPRVFFEVVRTDMLSGGVFD